MEIKDSKLFRWYRITLEESMKTCFKQIRCIK